MTNPTTEAVAKALGECDIGDGDAFHSHVAMIMDEPDLSLRLLATAAIQAHLAALARQGFVVVPRESTIAMQVAFYRAQEAAHESENPVQSTWTAMVAAGEKES